MRVDHDRFSIDRRKWAEVQEDDDYPVVRTLDYVVEHMLYHDMQNDGKWVMSDEDLWLLSKAGFVTSLEMNGGGLADEMYFHPNHWHGYPSYCRLQGSHVKGYYTFFVPLTEEATEWATRAGRLVCVNNT